MKQSILSTVLLLSTLLASNAAMADHELIVFPERHTDRQSDSGPDRHSRRPADAGNRRHTSRRSNAEVGSYRRPYLTTYFGGGYGAGGDVVGRFTDNFGDTDKVRSGGGAYFEGGLLAAFDTYTMLRLTAGYETDWTGRSNGQAEFSRTRFDLSLLRNFGLFELGVGLTAHVGVDYDCNINSICAGDRDFDNALGYTLEYALSSYNQQSIFRSRRSHRRNPLRTARLGLRFTDIEYTPEFEQGTVADNEVLDGRSLSLFVGFAL